MSHDLHYFFIYIKLYFLNFMIKWIGSKLNETWFIIWFLKKSFNFMNILIKWIGSINCILNQNILE